MNKVHAKVDNGVDTLLRVVSVLRRKEFDISDVNLTNGTDLEITLHPDAVNDAMKAKSQMEKLVGLKDINVL